MELKGTHIICLGISFYKVTQIPKSPRTNFCEFVKPQYLHVLLGEIWQ